jgi:hypothetical protein
MVQFNKMFSEAADHLSGMFGSGTPQIDTASEPPLVAPTSGTQSDAAATQAIVPPPPAGQAPPQIAQPQTTPSQATGPAPLQVAQQQTQFESGKKLSPELIQSGKDVQQEQRNAIGQQARVQAAGAELEQAELEKRARAVQTQNLADETEKNKIEQDTQAQVNDWKSAIADYKKFQDDTKAGKRSFKETRTTAQNIQLAIASALGALGSSLLRSPNYTQQVIDKQIDEHVRQEEAEERRLGKSVDLAQNGIAFFRQYGLDAQASRLARKQSLLDESRARVEAIAAASKSPEIQANAQALMANLDSQIQKNAEQRYLDAQGKAVTLTQRVPTGTGASIEDLKKLHEMSNQDPTLKDYRMARSSSDMFRALVEAKADGAAVMNFIAKGMQQGSFTPTFVDLLKKRGYIDAAGEAIRSKFRGGYDPELIKELQRGLDAVTDSTRARAEPAIRQFRTLGLPQSLIVGGNSEQETAASLGGVRK